MLDIDNGKTDSPSRAERKRIDEALERYLAAAKKAGENTRLYKKILAHIEKDEEERDESVRTTNGSNTPENAENSTSNNHNSQNMSVSGEKLDSATEIRYNRKTNNGEAKRQDLFTVTDAFIREVPHEARNAFVRSLAHKTSDLVEGEIKTIYIYSTARVYVFRADGYMHGEMVTSFIPKNKQMLEYIKNEYDKVDQDTENASLWTETIQSREDGRSGDSGIHGGGRSDSFDSLYEGSSESDTARDTEREWKNPRTKEEYDEIIKKLREMYGLAPKQNEEIKYSRKAPTDTVTISKGEMQK